MTADQTRLHQHDRVIAIVGPTAVGKTVVGELVAERLSGEIISADSMQVYRGLDIGTAKPPVAERRVPYHCLDLVDVGTPFSAASYQEAARESIGDVLARGKTPIVVGGTGLYLRAALDTLVFPAGEQVDNPVRERYQAYADEHGTEALHALLTQKDPASAALIHPNNTRRVIRAFELLAEGVSYARHHEGLADRSSIYDTRFFGLTMDRQRLYQRVDTRVDAMMEAGLLGEVESLLAVGLGEHLTAMQAIGYKEFIPVLTQGGDIEVAIAAVKQASRRYAKRQLTWFRADPRISWLDVTGSTPEQIAERIVSAVDSQST